MRERLFNLPVVFFYRPVHRRSAQAWLIATFLATPLFAQSDAPFFKLDPSLTPDLPAGVQWVNEGPNGEPSLRVDIAADAPSKMALVTIPIDIEALRDYEILLSYDVRAQDVSRPEKDYNGIKAQLHFESANFGPQWMNEGLLCGTFPWKRSSLLFRIPYDALKGELQLGLQESTGTAWLANVTIQKLRKKPERPPRRRGMVSSGAGNLQDLADLAAWNVNLVRWQLLNPQWTRTTVPTDPAKYEAWLRPKLDEFAAVLDQARQLGLKVILDLHFPPGGRYEDGTLRILMDDALQDYFMNVWTHIAQRFKGHPALWAYDIMNEPVQKQPSPPGLLNWFDLQAETARRIRAIDPTTAILIASDDWDSPGAFDWLRPVDVSNVIYTVHMYWPYEYTHQGTDGRTWNKDADKIAYPGTFNTLPLNKTALASHLWPVRNFQLTYGARIFVGEFSVARWAPGAAKYLADEISLFEDYGWDWTYHAFREESAWSLEDSNLPYGEAVRSSQPTDRFKVIQPYFEKNIRQ